MNEWISVEDRLPDDKVFVIISCIDKRNTRHVMEAMRDAQHYRCEHTRLDLGSTKPSWNTTNEKAFGFAKVTHWMPLPDPPETD